MGKVNYKFNKKSLQFEEVKVTFKARLLKALSVVATGMVFAAVVIFLAYTFLDSPKEKMLKREIAQYELQFDRVNERLDQYDAVLTDLADRDDNIYRVIFEADPVPSSIRKAGFGGTDRYAKLEGYKNSDLIIKTTERLDKIQSQLVVQSESFDEVFKLAKNKNEMLACIPAIQPVNNKDLKRLSSYYGYRTDPIYKVRKFHPGIDFSAPTGTEIYATGDGVIKDIVQSRRGYGNRLIIDHGYGYETMYAHIHEFKVKKGQKVTRGQLIATVGNTGKSTAPHLHYEIRKDGVRVNPIYYFFNDLSPEQYDMVLELSSRPTQTLD
ncbi:MAG TPA: M23 family metallopeptidase [Bacteroidales bacterium]|nr:M23 family metallopeptidase [Bacteroidales bacterium]HRX95642.1 M23 family metallopeptidase [Bacteroidales bacterium]